MGRNLLDPEVGRKRRNDSLPTHFDSVSTHFVRPRLADPVRPISTHVDPPNAAFASARAPSRRRLPSSSMSADPPALSIKLSRRGTFANPSRICANHELARTCANVRTRRESANLSRIRESVANLSRTRPTRCELVQTRSRTFANPSRIYRESARICATPVENFRESVANL